MVSPACDRDDAATCQASQRGAQEQGEDVRNPFQWSLEANDTCKGRLAVTSGETTMARAPSSKGKERRWGSVGVVEAEGGGLEASL
jgi:hypothetical protein